MESPSSASIASPSDSLGLVCSQQDDGSGRTIFILYGSVTGTAEDAAERLGREARRRHYRARVMPMNKVDKSILLDDYPIIFICSTSGQGDEPPNMKALWSFLLRSDLPTDFLEGLPFAVFGLGDSSYLKFNWPAKKLQRRLEMLGAHSIIPKGEGDEQHRLGIDAAFDPWMEELWKSLKELVPIPLGLQILPENARPFPRLRLRLSKEDCSPRPVTLPRDHVFATVKGNDHLTSPDHFQDTRLFELELDRDVQQVTRAEEAVKLNANESDRYAPGSVVSMQPENDPQDVDLFIKRLGWLDSADVLYDIEASSTDRPLPDQWPTQVTLRELLTYHLDIFSVPRRSFFEFLSHFTTDLEETEKLRDFCSSEGQEDRYDFANRPRRTIAEIIADFRSAKIPPEYASDIFPSIRPRQFSIASSSKCTPRKVELLIAIVKYRTVMRLARRGVCTSWLSRLKLGATIPIVFEPGSFRPPPDSSPVILVGPGTGIAPLRAIVLDRLKRGIHDNLVFFGCRSVEKDFYFAEEWQEAERQGHLKVVVAASRDQQGKIYVQNKLGEHAAQVWKLIELGAYIFISGSSGKMPKAVRETIREICKVRGRMDDTSVNAYMHTLEISGRLQEETW